MGAEESVFLVEVVPSFPCIAYYNLVSDPFGVPAGDIDLICRVAVGGTYYRAYLSDIEAVLEIVSLKLICCRYRNRAELIESQHCKPILIVTLQNEHNLVAFFNAEALEIICALI